MDTITEGAIALRQFRADNDMTQVELCRQLEIDQSLLSKIERGTRRPNVDLAVKIAKVAGISVELWTQHQVAEAS